VPRDVAQAIQADPLVDITGATGAKGYPSMCGVADVLVPSVAHCHGETEDRVELQVVRALMTLGRLRLCDLAREAVHAAGLHQRVCLKARLHLRDVCVTATKVERRLVWRHAPVVCQLPPAFLCECFAVRCEGHIPGNATGYFPSNALAHQSIKFGVGRHGKVANG
jgi:hypothetical protein